MQRYYTNNDVARAAGKMAPNVVRDLKDRMPRADAITSSGRALYAEATFTAWAASMGYDITAIVSDADAKVNKARSRGTA